MDLEGLLRPVLDADGIELVEVGLIREHGRRVLRVTVDREGGVDLDAIALASERVSRRLDLAGFNPGPYSLEVSSPGLERPLRELRDFARNVGERAKVKTAAPIDGAMTLSGTILEAQDGRVTMQTDGGVIELALEDIVSARTVLEWGGRR
jgi:ribosome maturation factor RimP